MRLDIAGGVALKVHIKGRCINNISWVEKGDMLLSATFLHHLHVAWYISEMGKPTSTILKAF